MKTCIHGKGAVEAVEKSNPPPAPPPAGDRVDLIRAEDRMDLTRTGGQNANKELPGLLIP